MTDIKQITETSYAMLAPSEIRAGDRAINVTNGATIWTAVTDAEIVDGEYDHEVHATVQFTDGMQLVRCWTNDEIRFAIVRGAA